jgi:hypothetical protein
MELHCMSWPVILHPTLKSSNSDKKNDTSRTVITNSKRLRKHKRAQTPSPMKHPAAQSPPQLSFLGKFQPHLYAGVDAR